MILVSHHPITSTSSNHPCVYVSLSGKTPCSFLRNNPMGNPTCRGATRSPVDFRLGRRASDGLVAQGILNQPDSSMNSIAFNSQRLHEACKAKGFLELHLLQQEAASLSSQYQSHVPQEELNVRQREHSQFHVTPIRAANSDHNAVLLQCGGYKYDDSYMKSVSGISLDISNYVGMMKNELNENVELNGCKFLSNVKGQGDQQGQQLNQMSKPPLQQQLMQHRLLQQKRQILQKQGAMEASLSRRQMLRQQSYKMAQNQQVLPPLPFPLSEKESEDLLAFQQIVENPDAPGINSSHLLKTTHLKSPSLSPQLQVTENGGPWNNLPNIGACHISEVVATHEVFHQQLCQVSSRQSLNSKRNSFDLSHRINRHRYQTRCLHRIGTRSLQCHHR